MIALHGKSGAVSALVSYSTTNQVLRGLVLITTECLHLWSLLSVSNTSKAMFWNVSGSKGLQLAYRVESVWLSNQYQLPCVLTGVKIDMRVDIEARAVC